MIKLNKHFIYADTSYKHIYIVDKTSTGFNIFKPGKGNIASNINEQDIELIIYDDIENKKSQCS